MIPENKRQLYKLMEEMGTHLGENWDILEKSVEWTSKQLNKYKEYRRNINDNNGISWEEKEKLDEIKNVWAQRMRFDQQ